MTCWYYPKWHRHFGQSTVSSDKRKSTEIIWFVLEFRFQREAGKSNIIFQDVEWEKCWSMYWLQGWVHSYETLWYHGLMGVNWRLEFASYPSPLKWSFTPKKVTLKCHWTRLVDSWRSLDINPQFSKSAATWRWMWVIFLGTPDLTVFFSDYAIYCLYIVWKGIIMYYIIIYFGRVCLGFFDWDTYPGSQAQLQGLSVKCLDFPVQSCVLFGSSKTSSLKSFIVVQLNSELRPDLGLKRWWYPSEPKGHVNVMAKFGGRSWIILETPGSTPQEISTSGY